MSDKVTYTDIVEALSSKTGFSKQKCEAFAKALIKEVKTELQENGKASITNFGSFKVKDIAERQGQNPQTGEPIIIPAHKRVTFSPYKALRTQVNAKYEHLEAQLIDDESQDAVSTPKDTTATTYEEAVNEQNNRVYFIIAMSVLLIIISLGLLWFSTRSGSELMTEDESVEQQIIAEPEPEEKDIASSRSVTTNDDQMDSKIQNQNESGTENDSNAATEDPPSSEIASAHEVQEDEWYWVIAEKEYGKAHFWPIIFQANFTTNHNPDSLETKTRIRIPALEGIPGLPTASDYQRLSEAFLMVSNAYANFELNDKAEEYARFAAKWERLSAGEKPE